MQASARLASSAASKSVIVGVRSTIPRSCYRTSRGKAHSAPLSSQEPPPKGQKRISRRERRVLIEDFVDKYRASNEGKFPSVTFVREHIGGAHYTVREILQELKYNHAHPPLDNAKSAQGQATADISDDSEPAQVQVSAQFDKHSWPKDDNGKNPNNSEAVKNDGQEELMISLKDATAGTTTIEKTEEHLFMGSINIVETEDGKPDFSISDSIKNEDNTILFDQTKSDSIKDLPVVETEAARADFKISDSIKNAGGPTLADQIESEGMEDIMNEPAVSLGVETKSDLHLGKKEGETKVNKTDFNNTGKSLNASKSTLSDQRYSDKVLKRDMMDSEHSPKHENKGSTETGFLGSLKSFAFGIKNFWKSL